MADKSQIKKITSKLESGIKELFESDKYMDYLKTMSRFHKYSTRNTLLIHIQNPNATVVAGYQAWIDKFKRQVRGSEKSIKIFAPIASKKKAIEVEKIDAVTKLPILDEHGNPVTETLQPLSASNMRFRLVSVFDVSQTDGEPLPTLAENIVGDVNHYDLFMDTLKAVSPLPIVLEPLPENMDGVCRFGDKIAIREGMSEIRTACAGIHEIAHAKLHDRSMLEGNIEKPKSRRTQEVEAESISYAVCQYYGIETGANSFGYLAEWSKTQELKELNASLDTIRKTVAELIDGIDEQYRTLAKERGIDISASTEQPIESNEAAPSPQIAPLPVPNETRPIGETVLMPLLYDNGNLNRTGKRTRVRIEPPIGKYPVYSYEMGTPPYSTNYAYIPTASGKLIQTGEMEKLPNLTEEKIDKHFTAALDNFEKMLADPTVWAVYDTAAILDRIGEAEAHNVPVRAMRDAEYEQERAEQNAQDEAERAEREGIFNVNVDNIAVKLTNGERVTIERDTYIDKNPLLALFNKHSIDVPIATKGWINRKLKAFQLKPDGRLTVWGAKGLKISETFAHALRQLQGKLELASQSKKETEVKYTLEHKNYEKLTELFPEFMNQKYSYLRLESEGFEPLTLEWTFGDRLVMLHTYTMNGDLMNGDLMYDPMIEFSVNTDTQTMTAVSFEQSMPPLYQRIGENGNWHSVDGNGNERIMKDRQSEIDSFTSQWIRNISGQGFMPVRATLWNDGGIDDIDVRITFDDEGNPIMPEPEVEPPQATELDILLPDPNTSIADRNDFGYTYDGMFPLSDTRAAELFDSHHLIYLLYPDGTESMADTLEQILEHDGLCGIERDDWERSPIFAAQKAAEINFEGSMEADLIHGSMSKFGIYQIPSGIDESRNFRFASMKELDALGLGVDRENYELVYTAPLVGDDTQAILNKLFADFNVDHPIDFAARSLSVSDVIVLQQHGEVSSHYVDSIGFKELQSFTGNEKDTAENTLSQIETRSQGEQQSAPKGKPTMLERLEVHKQKVGRTTGTEVSNQKGQEV